MRKLSTSLSPTEEKSAKIVAIPGFDDLTVSIYPNRVVTVKLQGILVVRFQLGKNNRGFVSAKLDSKKYFISVEQVFPIGNFKVSLYSTKELVFSTGPFEESNWERKRLSLLNRKDNSKVHTGEIFLDNLFLSIISRIFDW